METVKRAIIMAAGFGSRLSPITKTIPKPLIKVNGISMVETIIEGLLENDIKEIHIVVGHLKEKFYQLKEKYPFLDIIENPYYATCNNISSLYVAREYLGETIILDGDQIIYNSNILKNEIEHSGYCCEWTNEQTNEWLLNIDSNNAITHCNRNGGFGGWILHSVSFWTKKDGKKLRKLVERAFDKEENRQLYWDDIAMFLYPNDIELYIRAIDNADLVEIDNLSELAELDKQYEKYVKEY